VPYVNIKNTEEGATTDQKKQLIQGVTNMLHDILAENRQTTAVVIEEVDTDDWGIAGEMITERGKRENKER
jgi:4-oxalocrotonate tautomerase